MLLLCVMFALALLLFPAKASAATGLNVDTHTQAEIKAYFERIESSSSFAVTYDEKPVTKGPNYSAGKLSQQTLQGAVDMLNFMRYIAGIPYDVQLNDSYNQMAQAGALVNAVNNQMSHSPSKPQDMDADLYQLGYKGCSSSNLSYGDTNFRDGIAGWVSDEYNVSGSNPGHRRWCLNPTMTATGFGKVGIYDAMYAFDNLWAPTSYTGVAWPAQQMPTQFFNTRTQWSISFGRAVNTSNTTVTLTRKSDGREWNFDSSLSQSKFLVDNDGYGQAGCVVFKPTGIHAYRDGDVYNVVVKEGGSIIADYDVNFFDFQPEGKPSTKPAKISISKLTSSDKSSIKVTWTKTDADGYQVCYATTKSFKSYRTKTVSKGSMTSTNLTNLKKGKTYYVKVRAYKLDENGKKIYGLFSQAKKIKNK